MEFGPIPPSKFDEVIQHLRHNFPDEPLNASVGLCVHGQVCELLEHHDLVTLQDGLSVMAMDPKTGDVSIPTYFRSPILWNPFLIICKFPTCLFVQQRTISSYTIIDQISVASRPITKCKRRSFHNFQCQQI